MEKLYKAREILFKLKNSNSTSISCYSESEEPKIEKILVKRH